MTKIKPTIINSNANKTGHKNNAELTFAVSLMEHLVIPTFVLDAQCKVLIWNRACERLTGLSASELIGTSDHWRAFYNEPRDCLADLIAQNRVDEVKSLYSQHESSMLTGYGLYAENWCTMPQLGTRLYLAINAGAIYEGDGKLIAVVETIRDMTIQKQAQMALQELATRDGLTGLANRRCFDDTLQSEWRRAMRSSQLISILMIDVDYFKQYNDTYGHLQGDECLKLIATAMAGVIHRVSDLVARYGGEEFVVILPGNSLDGTRIVAEKIRLAIEKLKLTHEKSDKNIVTVSIGGAAVIASQASDSANLLAAADAALYRAKHSGRNRVDLQDDV